MDNIKPFEMLAALKQAGIVAWWVFLSEQEIRSIYNANKEKLKEKNQ